MAWDALGNLRWRHDRGGMRDQREWFDYDARDRMEEVRRQIGFKPIKTAQRLRFDASGNIRCKSDVPGTSTSCAAGNRTFTFDANGNVIRDRVNGVIDRRFDYASYDKIRRLTRGSGQVEFHYGADRSRTLKVERESGVIVKRTHYVGTVEVVWE